MAFLTSMVIIGLFLVLLPVLITWAMILFTLLVGMCVAIWKCLTQWREKP